MMNRTMAAIFLLALSPLFILVSIAIFMEDGCPVFFKQKRVGKDYSFFHIYKFRTMAKGTPNVATHLLIDPMNYLLKVGSILRKTSLDELPNLISILKGDMVFVGPRPALYNQEDLMTLRVKTGVSKIKPGLTGWAQINGRDEISIVEKVRLDQEYLIQKSWHFDFMIIIKTFVKVFIHKEITH